MNLSNIKTEIVQRSGATMPAGSRITRILAQLIYFAGNEIVGMPAGQWTVTIVLTTVDEICCLHDAYFGDPSETDVISFPSGDDFNHLNGHLGDIVICIGVAAEQALESGHSLNREVAFLALHGILHLSGYNDESEEERVQMLARQEALLAQYEHRFGAIR